MRPRHSITAIRSARVLPLVATPAMIAAMRVMAWLGWGLLLGWPLQTHAAPPSPPPPRSVAILYNTASQESCDLARIYQKARGIPEQNLVGMAMPVTPDIKRAEYDRSIARPLRAEFDRRHWWQRSRASDGTLMPVQNKIRVLVTMRGVPLRIEATPKPAGKAGAANAQPANLPAQFVGRDDASVDSELAMVGVEGLPTEGALANKFYQSSKSWMDAPMPFLILTSRIDAATMPTCERMIRDAVEVEPSGLWGMAYVDIANKFPQGDQWLEAIIKANHEAGILTVVDRFNETFPKNYPMTDAALYYGWYDWSVSGPFLHPQFRFRKGAVAMHLHSFSAQQLRDGMANWAAPLLERGAAATVGNVFEPYLHLTHDFALLHQRLLAGDCWVEACWKAMPAASWQGVVLGDPLYQPFRHFDNRGTVLTADKPYRALRAAALEWPNRPDEQRKQLAQAVDRNHNSRLAEALALKWLASNDSAHAATLFRRAREYASDPSDQVRQDLHVATLEHAAGRKDVALRSLRDARNRYGHLPEAAAIDAWLLKLDPPPATPKAPAGATPPPSPMPSSP